MPPLNAYSLGKYFLAPNLHSYQIQDGGLNTKMCTRASKIRLHCRLIKDEWEVLLTDKFYSERANLWHRAMRILAILLVEKIKHLHFPPNFVLNIFYLYL